MNEFPFAKSDALVSVKVQTGCDRCDGVHACPPSSSRGGDEIRPALAWIFHRQIAVVTAGVRRTTGHASRG